MKNLFVIILLLLAGLNACRENPKEKDIIPPERMSRILTDVLLAKEAYVQKKSLFDKDSIQPVESVLKSYGIDSVAFKRSLIYYGDRPEMFEEIYKRVIKQLEHKRDSLDAVIRAKRPEKQKSANKNKEGNNRFPVLNPLKGK